MTASSHNPWGISFMRMFDMANDSHLFLDAPGPGRLPLYEAKLIHQFDHRWATYTPDGDSRNMTLAEKQDPHSSATPRYWVDQREVWLRVSRLPETQRKALRDDKPGADVPTQSVQATQTAQVSFDFSDNTCSPSTPQPIAHEAQTEHLLKASCPKWLMG